MIEPLRGMLAYVCIISGHDVYYSNVEAGLIILTGWDLEVFLMGEEERYFYCSVPTWRDRVKCGRILVCWGWDDRRKNMKCSLLLLLAVDDDKNYQQQRPQLTVKTCVDETFEHNIQQKHRRLDTISADATAVMVQCHHVPGMTS